MKMTSDGERYMLEDWFLAYVASDVDVELILNESVRIYDIDMMTCRQKRECIQERRRCDWKKNKQLDSDLAI